MTASGGLIFLWHDSPEKAPSPRPVRIEMSVDTPTIRIATEEEAID